MRDRTAAALLLGGLLLVAVGLQLTTTDLPASSAPNATFAVDGDADAGEIVVEHTGGGVVDSGSIAVLVYEDRPFVPDRTVHSTAWRTDDGTIAPGDRLELDDQRFASGQRLVVRWFGEAGQANVHEEPL